MNASAGQAIGLIVALGGAAVGLVATDRRVRTAALAVALVAAVALIRAEVWDTTRLASLRDHPPVAVAAAIAVLAAVAALGFVFRRWPNLFVLTALLTLPLRIPLDIGGATSNLLVPLYLVIAGGVAASIPAALAQADGPLIRSSGATWVTRLLALILLLYAAQAMYSLDVKNAIETTAFFYVPFAALFALLEDVTLTRRLLGQILVAMGALMAVLAVIGIVELATRDLILNADLRAENALHIYFRVNAIFRDPNIFGRYLALGIVAFAGYLAWERRPPRAVAAFALAGLMLAALAFSFSLTSFAALLAGLVVIAWARLGTKVTAAAVIAVLVAGAVYAAAFGASGTEVSSGGAGRTSLVRGGLDLARDRPVWGYGSGSFGEAFYTRIEKAKTTASHDTPIEVAAEQGAIGLLAYGALLLVAAMVLFGSDVRGSPVRVTIAGLFLAMLVHTLGYASFLEDPATWAILALGLLAARAGLDPPPEPAPA
jgi:putative inorganic carbon (HCO3(-)) transporter